MSQDLFAQGTTVSGLLGLLESSGARQCAELRARTAEQIAEIRRQAFRQSRERFARAVAEERSRMAKEVGRVEAELDTELRRRSLKHDACVVAEGRAGLEQALRKRWSDREARSAWCCAILAQAAQVLLAGDWTLVCPADWPEDERQRAIAHALDLAGASLQVAADPDLCEGFRLRCGGITLDMSIEGLLADQDAVDGELLAFNRRLQSGDSR